MERAWYFHIHFQTQSLMPLVKILVLLLRVSSLLLLPIRAYLLLWLLGKSLIFINPEEYHCETRGVNCFPCTFDIPFLVSLPDCPVGTILGKHVHPPPVIIISRKNNRRYSELRLIITLFFKSLPIPVEPIPKEYFLSL